MLEKQFHSELTIYPNPGNGLLYIDDMFFENNSTQLQFEVRNMNGQIQMRQSGLYQIGDTTIDLMELPTGLYSIRILMPDNQVETMLYSKI